jgi:TonB family protein
MRTKTLLAALLCVLFASPAAQSAPDAYIPDRLKGILLYAPVPNYPEAARNRFTVMAQGVYRLKINQQNGSVDEVGTLKRSGHHQLDGTMVLTLFKWRFKPGAIKELDVPVSFEREVFVDLRKSASR